MVKVTKIIAGEYKVVCKAGTFIVAQLYDNNGQPFGWDIFVGEERGNNALAWVFNTKREAIEAIKQF